MPRVVQVVSNRHEGILIKTLPSITISRLPTTIHPNQQHKQSRYTQYITTPKNQLLFKRSFWTRSTSSTTPLPANTMAPRTSIEDFQDLIKSSNRILALCGAGLSASSGLPTFRGAGGLWRNHDPTDLATPEAFESDPALVWLFYAWRRHLCLQAEPNAGHRALAELATRKKDFLCLTQNVDGE